MQGLENYLKLIQDNWVTFTLIMVGAYIFLHALALFFIRLSKMTETKADDNAAKGFAKFVEALGYFFQDLGAAIGLKPKDKKPPKDAGFVTNDLIVYLMIALGGLVIGYSIKASQQPSKVETTINHEAELKQEIELLNTKIIELQKYKKSVEESKKFASKEKHYYATGQLKSEKDVSENQFKLTDEQIELQLQMTIDYNKKVADLKEQLRVQELTKNSSGRADFRIVYDSERGQEYEGNADSGFYSFGAGINPDKQAWRVGAGLGFNF